jgi:hypothetical protein
MYEFRPKRISFVNEETEVNKKSLHRNPFLTKDNFGIRDGKIDFSNVYQKHNLFHMDTVGKEHDCVYNVAILPGIYNILFNRCIFNENEQNIEDSDRWKFVNNTHLIENLSFGDVEGGFQLNIEKCFYWRVVSYGVEVINTASESSTSGYLEHFDVPINSKLNFYKRNDDGCFFQRDFINIEQQNYNRAPYYMIHSLNDIKNFKIFGKRLNDNFEFSSTSDIFTRLNYLSGTNEHYRSVHVSDCPSIFDGLFDQNYRSINLIFKLPPNQKISLDIVHNIEYFYTDGHLYDNLFLSRKKQGYTDEDADMEDTNANALATVTNLLQESMDRNSDFEAEISAMNNKLNILSENTGVSFNKEDEGLYQQTVEKLHDMEEDDGVVQHIIGENTQKHLDEAIVNLPGVKAAASLYDTASAVITDHLPEAKLSGQKKFVSPSDSSARDDTPQNLQVGNLKDPNDSDHGSVGNNMEEELNDELEDIEEEMADTIVNDPSAFDESAQEHEIADAEMVEKLQKLEGVFQKRPWSEIDHDNRGDYYKTRQKRQRKFFHEGYAFALGRKKSDDDDDRKKKKGGKKPKNLFGS